MIARTYLAAFAAALATFGLSACGGSAVAPNGQTVPLVHATPTSNPLANITIKIVVPAKAAASFHLHASSTVSRAAKPLYVSPSTASIAISVNGGKNGAVTVPVACASFPCSVSAVLSAPTNQNDTFSIIAYDGKTPASALSDGSVTEFVPLGLTTIGITLGGIVANVQSVDICPSTAPNCTSSEVVAPNGPSQWSVSISQATDADGNVIVGAFDSPIELQLNEVDLTLNALALSKTQLLASNDSAQLNYNGSFDGQNAVDASVQATYCDSAGNPSTNCGASQYNSANGFAVFQVPCPSGTIACSSHSAYGWYSLGVYAGGMAAMNGSLWFNDYNQFVDQLSQNGIAVETPSDGATPGPPASLSQGQSIEDFAPVNGTMYLYESSNVASMTPGTASGTGAYAEYTSAAFSNIPFAAAVAGSDGNYYAPEDSGGTPEIGRFDVASHSVDEFNFCSTDAEVALASLGSNIWFAASSALGNGKFTIGYMPVTQSPAATVPCTNEFSVGRDGSSGSDWWQVAYIAAVPSGGSLPNGMIFFDGYDMNGAASMIGTFNPSTHAVTIYPLPASWPSSISVTQQLGEMAYNPLDGFVYFVDGTNGIIGRIPSVSPSTASIQGYATPVNESWVTGQQVEGELVVDPSNGIIYTDSLIPVPGQPFSPPYGGITSVNPTLAKWTSSPVSGGSVEAIAHPESVHRFVPRSSPLLKRHRRTHR